MLSQSESKRKLSEGDEKMEVGNESHDTDPQSKKKRFGDLFEANFENAPDDVLLTVFDTMGLRYRIDSEKATIEELAGCCPTCYTSEFTFLTETEFATFNKNYDAPSTSVANCGNCIDIHFHELSAVCNRWKNLIEYYHRFQNLKFFEQPRTIRDYELLLECQKKYYSVSFSAQPDLQVQLYFLGKFLEDQPQIKQAKISCFRYYFIMAADFQYLLRKFIGFSSLQINVGHISMIIPRISYSTRFLNLKHLTIKAFNEYYCCGLADFLEAPNLESLKIVFTSFNHVQYTWYYIMSFMNCFSSSLKRLDIVQHVSQKNTFRQLLHWSTEDLVIYSVCTNYHQEQLTIFLENRLQALKKINLKFCTNRYLLNWICRGAENVEELILDFCCLKRLDFQMQLPSVKRLYTHHDIVESYYTHAFQVFPNALYMGILSNV